MGCWVAAFVGDNARENYESLRRTGDFWVSSTRTPIRKVRSDDQILLYMSGEGFVGEAVAASEARAPYGEVRWSGKAAVLGISLEAVRVFSAPVLYKFPHKGPHPTLGFHRFALTGGFTSLTEAGLEDVRIWAASPEDRSEGSIPEKVPSPIARTRVAEASPASEYRTATPTTHDEAREKRVAGQHAKAEGRKRAALWTLAEIGAGAVGWKGAEAHAQERIRAAERTWIAGGTAEEKVGAVLDELVTHGFYVFHDVALPKVGNVDHVVLGPRGFFGIETKSHKGKVTARGNQLLLNGRPPDKDFVSQTWRGCYRLKDIVGAEVTPVLCFSEAFVEGRVFVKGVRVLPIRWLKQEIPHSEVLHDSRTVALAVNALGTATGCYPSAVPRLG